MTPTQRPNILFILVDQMRYAPRYPGDPNEGLYRILRFEEGVDAQDPLLRVLPGFAELRKYGVSLQNHMASSMACVPSRGTLFTGQYSARTGVTQTEGMFKIDTDPAFPWLPCDGVPTLGDWFRAAGYETHYFGRWDLSNPPVGSLEPWGFADWEASYPSDQRFGNNNLGVYRDKGYTPLVENFLKRKALGAELNVINSNNPTNATFLQKPWLAVASFVNPHDIGAYPFPWKPAIQEADASLKGTGANSPLRPYGAPPAGTRANPPQYGDTVMPWKVPLNPLGFGIDDVALPPNWARALDDKPTCQADYAYKFQIALTTLRGQNFQGPSPYPFQMQPDGGRSWYTAYAEFYLYLQYLVNLEIAAVMSCLRETGLDQSTIVVFTADHGEQAGAHGGMIEKWHNIYQESLHVPAVICSPSLNADDLRALPNPSTHVDWIPTLLGLAGYDAIARAQLGKVIQGHTVAPLPGRDLSPLLRGEPTAADPGLLFVARDEITAPLDSDYLPQRFRWYLQETAALTAPDGQPTPQQPLVAPGPVVQPNNVAGWFELPWKLGRYTDPKGQVTDQWELYNLDVDPFEDSNLVSWDASGQPVVRQDVAVGLGLDPDAVQDTLDRMRGSLDAAMAAAGY